MPIENDLTFPAVLKNSDGEILANGQATVLKKEQAINFKSDFVPLYPIGTSMEIDRIEDGQEIHRFLGKVYLSDKKLMRLVSVDDILLPGSENFYNKNLGFSAMLSDDTTGNDAKKGKRRIFLRSKSQSPENLDCYITISTMSEDGFVFLHDMDTPLEKGQTFLLTTEPPVPLTNVKIQIKDVFLFGQRAAYVGVYSHLDAEVRRTLIDFLAEYHYTHHKFFTNHSEVPLNN